MGRFSIFTAIVFGLCLTVVAEEMLLWQQMAVRQPAAAGGALTQTNMAWNFGYDRTDDYQCIISYLGFNPPSLLVPLQFGSNDSFTASFWWMPVETTRTEGMLAFGVQWDEWMICYAGASSQLVYHLNESDGDEHATAAYTFSMNTSEWSLVTMVCNRTNHTLYGYYNGVEAATVDISAIGSLSNEAAYLVYGNFVGAPTYYGYIGRLDAAGVWGHVVQSNTVYTFYTSRAYYADLPDRLWIEGVQLKAADGWFLDRRMTNNEGFVSSTNIYINEDQNLNLTMYNVLGGAMDLWTIGRTNVPVQP